MVKNRDAQGLRIDPAIPLPYALLYKFTRFLVEITDNQPDAIHTYHKLLGKRLQNLVAQLSRPWPSWPLSVSIETTNCDENIGHPMSCEQYPPNSPVFMRPREVKGR